MTTQFLDLVRQQITNSGTGDLNLGAAVSGWLTVALAGGVDGQTYSYGIIDPGNTVTQTECGTCVWHSGTNSITRTPSHSTNGNAAINASGQAHIIFGVTAEDMNLLYSTVFWNGARVGTRIFPLTPNNSSGPTQLANTASLQAANDYACTNKISDVEISAGNFYLAPGFYLDIQNNLRAPGQFQFTTNPVAGNVIVIFGTTLTYVVSGATGLQINVGGSLATTLANTLAVLNASSDINLTKFTYGVVGNNLNVTAVANTPTILGTTVSGVTILGASAPVSAQFSLHLKGAGGQTNNNGYGTQLFFTDNSQVAIIVGPGQGQTVSGLTVASTVTPTSRAALPVSSIGFGIGGGTGGASRTLFEQVGVWGFRKGYCTGFNADQLCDSNSWIKCSAFECYVGAHIKQTQNFINSFINCDFGGNTTHFLSDVAKAVNVYGGNFSTVDAFHNAFTIGSYTNLVYFLDSSQLGFGTDNATFTVHISAPDQAIVDGAYDTFVINTTAFGPVPLLLTNYNSGTQVATFKFLAGWLNSLGFQTAQLNGGALATTFNTALSAATTLYACETVTPFKGFCFNVDGVHIENPGVFTTFFNQTSGFGGDYASRFNRITFNYTVTQLPYHGGGAANEATFQCQQSFPFISMMGQNNGSIELTNIVNTATLDKVLFDAQESSIPLYRRVMVKNCDLKFNLRSPSRAAASGTEFSSTATGFGEFDNNPFPPTTDNQSYTQANMFGYFPYVGYFPAPYVTPPLEVNDLNKVQASPLGAIGSYPPLMGRTPYRVYYVNPQTAQPGPTPARYAESNHTFWSYGQTLNVTWSYVAGSNIVALSDTSRVFAGLRVLLNNGGGNEAYNVSGVYPTLGFITVVRWRPGTGVNDTAGTAGTTYTDTHIFQEPFSFNYISTMPAVALTSNTNAGNQTAAQGDMTGGDTVILTLSAIGANNYTTRTAALFFSDIAGCYVGYTYFIEIKNTSGGLTTLVGGTGVTISGTATIAAGTVRKFAVTIVSATAVTITNEGSWSI